MKRTKRAAGILLALLLGATALPATGLAQDAGASRPRRSVQNYDRAYEVGFDAGYRKGYGMGVADQRDGKRREVTTIREYNRAVDIYNKDIGDKQQFTLGYQAGFEKGYGDAYEGRQYGARPGETRVAIPSDQGSGPVLQRGGQASGDQGYDPNAQPPDPNAQPSDPSAQAPDPGANASGPLRVSFDTSLVIELDTPITTRYSAAGDHFQAHVVEPQPYAGARVEGHISSLTRPGKVKGQGEIILAFERIIFADGYEEPLQAQVERIIGYPNGSAAPGRTDPVSRAPWDWGKKRDRNDDIDAQVDSEGRIEGQDSKKRDAATVGGGAAAGAVLGGILGGGSGAVLGGVLGGAAGGGAVAATKGADIDLEPGAQLQIRTGRQARGSSP